MTYQYHNDLSVPLLTVCPSCGKRGLRDVRPPTGVKGDVDDVKVTGKKVPVLSLCGGEMTTTVRERPILFSGPMVKVILEGRKTQTRRVMKPQPGGTDRVGCYYDANHVIEWVFADEDGDTLDIPGPRCPYGQVGDRLWVRETWGVLEEYSVLKPKEMPPDIPVYYKAEGLPVDIAWKPSIHMPRWASRILLEVTDIRVERVQGITPYDALLEGLDLPMPPGVDAPEPPPEYEGWSEERREYWIEGQARAMLFARYGDAEDHIQAFRHLWNSINAKRGYGWETNCWVWVVSFRKL